MLKYKNAKGEEIEIEETEVIKAVQEEYEKKLTAKEEEIKKINEKHEEEKEKLRQEHVKQLRTVLTGRKEVQQQEEFEEKEEDSEETLVNQAKDIYKKLVI